VQACQREQESFVICHSTIEAATAVSNRPAPLNSGACGVPNGTAGLDEWARSSWPFTPDDVSPLQWWRTMPADHLCDAQHLLLRATLENVYFISGRKWFGGLHGDAAACIAVAFGILPVVEITFEVDVVMSALTANSLGGNAASALVLSHILRLAPLNHSFGRELSVSWLILNLRRALSARAIAVATCPKVGAQHSAAARAAVYAGELS
jgi:hypothetical protein